MCEGDSWKRGFVVYVAREGGVMYVKEVRCM